MKEKILISFVVPVRNGANTLADTLASIVSQTRKDFELIVVDNASTDTTAAIIRSFNAARYVYCAEVGRAAARNAGVAAARGDYVAFVDADVVLERTWLRKTFEYLQEHRLDAVATTLIPEGKELVDQFRFAFGDWRSHGTFLSLQKPNGPAPVVNTAACIMTKKSILAVGGFDKAVDRNEDLDLSLRLFFSGYLLGGTTRAKGRVSYDAGAQKFLGRELSYLQRSFLVNYQITERHGGKRSLTGTWDFLRYLKDLENKPLLTFGALVELLCFSGALAANLKYGSKPKERSIRRGRKGLLYSFFHRGTPYSLRPELNLLCLDHEYYLFSSTFQALKLKPSQVKGFKQLREGKSLTSLLVRSVLQTGAFESAKA